MAKARGDMVLKAIEAARVAFFSDHRDQEQEPTRVRMPRKWFQALRSHCYQHTEKERRAARRTGRFRLEPRGLDPRQKDTKLREGDQVLELQIVVDSSLRNRVEVE